MTPIAEQRTAAAAKAACEARAVEVECELRLERLRRRDREAAEEGLRKRERREARRDCWKRWWGSSNRRRGALSVLIAVGVPALIALLIYALAADPAKGSDGVAQTSSSIEILGIGLLTAASSFAVGALLGFLFGIPRSLATQPPAPPPASPSDEGATDGGGGAEAAAAQHFAPNTNLEQISDWLTKILVGVGLVQIHQVSGAVEDLANGLAPGLGSQGFTVAVALLIAFSVTGFLSAYLYTRLNLQRAFERAVTIKQAVREKVSTESTAIALVQRQLMPGAEKPTLAELTKALKAATPGTRDQAFFLARKQRKEDWKASGWADGGSDEEKDEFPTLSVPVFEALIASDTEKKARSWAEKAYALLKEGKEEIGEAKTALDNAIELRGPLAMSRTHQYELNRAYCTVMLNPGSVVDSTIEEVCSDVKVAIQGWSQLKAERRSAIKDWLELNSDPASTSARGRAAALLNELSPDRHSS